ncbi:MAG: polyribonucleotide nucleotidyltransferase [Bacteriovoracaceae bacterium]|nr:polyribonucleotide nucleotidyltransferase [Bacteriovoracaceae bacterium]
MNTNKKEYQFTFGDKEITIETGRLAKQADGAVLVTCGKTQVLVTVCSAKEAAPEADFFPLLVDYKEKFYAAGKFLGGFNKREGRPSNGEILLMRMIDRPLRPLFPEGYFCETIVTAQVLSYEENCDPEVLAGLGSCASLVVSDIPFFSPVGFCKVGYINKQYILNPTPEQFKKSELEIVVAASKDAILMVEGEANEVSEEVMLGAINFAHTEIKKFCEVMVKMQKEVGKAKREFKIDNSALTSVTQKIKTQFFAKVQKCLAVNDKMERQNAVSALKKEVKEALAANPGNFGVEATASFGSLSNKAIEDILYHTMREDILANSKRIGGRDLKTIRKIQVETDVLKNAHGSSLFTRGETQVLGVVTLGGKEGEQLVDRISGVTFDRFYLHYTFAPYSVGEARGYRGVGRREIGHGNLAERALKKVLPADAYPYTVRICCEVLESNGSSSMGSVCSGSMALMDAGVPIKAPVAGIAMGLIKEGEKYKILSDILGDEDHLGDMDFKVAGTKDGITAIQMDIKITGITSQIMQEAMSQAKEGRMHILKEMTSAISTSRGQYKVGVPVIGLTKIAPDQIGMLIGPGGKNIRALQEEYKVTIECQEDGTIKVLGPIQDNVDTCISTISLQMNGPEVNSEYEAKVVSLKEYGAFVDIAAGISGLVHVSEISNDRVQDINEYLKEGDKVKVRVLDVDRFGKIKFSIKAIAPLNKRANDSSSGSISAN